MWLVAPFILLAFIVVVSLQRGEERKNLSRAFLESMPVNILGFVSYPICKLLLFIYSNYSVVIHAYRQILFKMSL